MRMDKSKSGSSESECSVENIKLKTSGIFDLTTILQKARSVVEPELPTKSSAEILTELFSAFNAEPPTIPEDDVDQPLVHSNSHSDVDSIVEPSNEKEGQAEETVRTLKEDSKENVVSQKKKKGKRRHSRHKEKHKKKEKSKKCTSENPDLKDEGGTLLVNGKSDTVETGAECIENNNSVSEQCGTHSPKQSAEKTSESRSLKNTETEQKDEKRQKKKRKHSKTRHGTTKKKRHKSPSDKSRKRQSSSTKDVCISNSLPKLKECKTEFCKEISIPAANETLEKVSPLSINSVSVRVKDPSSNVCSIVDIPMPPSSNEQQEENLPIAKCNMELNAKKEIFEVTQKPTQEPVKVEVKIPTFENVDSKPGAGLFPTDKSKSKIIIKNLKFSAVFQQTVKEVEEQARKKAERFEDGEISDSNSEKTSIKKGEEQNEEVTEISQGEIEDDDGEIKDDTSTSKSSKKEKRRRSEDRRKHRKHSTEEKEKKHKHHHKERESNTKHHHPRRKSLSPTKSTKKSEVRRWSRSRSKSRSQSHSHSHKRKSRSRSRDRDRSHGPEPNQQKGSFKEGKKIAAPVVKDTHRSASEFPVVDLREKIDKKKLLEIARKNAMNMFKQGSLPSSVGQDKLLTLKAGGKSVEELTDFCKQLSRKEALGESSSETEDLKDSESESEQPFIHHPFQIKERPASIVLNIRNAVQLPVKTLQEKTVEQAKLRIQFPVSSGQQHRKTEWVPVLPKKEEKPKVEAVISPPPPPPEVEVFPIPANLEDLDIGCIVSQRLTAMRKLQENPNDVEALNEMYKAQKDMQAWAASKQQPGQFTGSTGAKVLTQAELASGFQAWAKRDQLKDATPVSGGMGMYLLQKMGWKPGEGLGKNKEGTLEPLQLDVKMDKKGLVSQEELFRRVPNHPPLKDLTGKHPVSALVELSTKRKWGVPQFDLVFESGPDHKKNFLYKVSVNGVEYKPAVASPNKKQAKAHAASLCLQAMGYLPKQ